MFVTKSRYETELAQARKERDEAMSQYEETARLLAHTQSNLELEASAHKDTARLLAGVQADFRLEVRKRTVLETALCDVQLLVGMCTKQLMEKVKARTTACAEANLALNRGEEPPVRD